MQRQALRKPRLPRWVILDQAALVRVVGSPAIMDAQIRHLLDLSEQPDVTIQAIPFTAGATPACTVPS